MNKVKSKLEEYTKDDIDSCRFLKGVSFFSYILIVFSIVIGIFMLIYLFKSASVLIMISEQKDIIYKHEEESKKLREDLKELERRKEVGEKIKKERGLTKEEQIKLNTIIKDIYINDIEQQGLYDRMRTPERNIEELQASPFYFGSSVFIVSMVLFIFSILILISIEFIITGASRLFVRLVVTTERNYLKQEKKDRLC
jgi:hypothetical protein